MSRILVIEDEESLAMLLNDRLVREGFLVDSAPDGRNGLEAALTREHDLVILDLMLPDIDGFEVCRHLRGVGVITPVLMLTARGDVRDRVAGLECGADDYLPKPFEVSELLARIQALLRRSGLHYASRTNAIMSFGSVIVDRARRVVTRDGQRVELSLKEFQMLCYLLDRPHLPVSREELLQNVWGYERTPTTRTVDVHMAQLRGKLEENPRDPRHLITAHGFGYKWVPSQDR